MDFLPQIIVGIYVLSVISSLLIFFIAAIVDKRNDDTWQPHHVPQVIGYSLTPVINTLTVFAAIYIAIFEIIPEKRVKNKEKRNEKMEELEAINQPLECLVCGVYTRKGHIDIFNAGNDEQKCPSCEKPLNVKEATIPEDYNLPFGKKFTFSDFENKKQKTHEQLKANFEKEQNEKYLKARETIAREYTQNNK